MIYHGGAAANAWKPPNFHAQVDIRPISRLPLPPSAAHAHAHASSIAAASSLHAESLLKNGAHVAGKEFLQVMISVRVRSVALTEKIVQPSLLVIADNSISLVDLFQPLFAFGVIVVPVRVILHSKSTIGLLDILNRSRTGESDDLVVVLVHQNLHLPLLSSLPGGE